MVQRKRVFELARDLGTKPGTIIHLAEALQIPVIRVVAELTPGQEARIRDLYERGDWRARERRDREAPQVADPVPAIRYGTCSCCGLHFRHDPGLPAGELRCAPCREHYEIEGEAAARTIVRLSEHERRLRMWYEHAAEQATDNERRMHEAYRSRQKWKAALVEAVLGHEPKGTGGCTCGASESPCTSVRIVDATNRGITREIERLGGLSRRALEAELYGDDPWRINLILDDDPAAGRSAPAA